MNHKLLLVNAITLLYRESQIVETHENSAQLVREILQSIRLPETSLGYDHDREIIEGLKSTALSMCEDTTDHTYEPLEVLQRLKVNTVDDEDLYDALRTGIEPELAPNTLKKTCLNIKKTLNNHFRDESVKEVIGKAFYTIKFARTTITDMRKFVTEITDKLDPYTRDMITKDPAIVSDVDLSDEDGVADVYNSVKDMEDGTGILKTGYQAINRMLDGGFRRGEEVVIGALQHNYKTGFSLSLFKQMALYNTPQMIDNNKKPLLVRISFEDDISLNFQFLYQSLKENETGEAVDVTKVSNRTMARYVQERLGINGYHIKLLRVDPTQWTYKDITNKLSEYESEGYEIHVCMLDYLTMVPTVGCTQGPFGHDIRDMYRRMRNYCNP